MERARGLPGQVRDNQSHESDHSGRAHANADQERSQDNEPSSDRPHFHAKRLRGFFPEEQTVEVAPMEP
jgi:hypothetical protein